MDNVISCHRCKKQFHFGGPNVIYTAIVVIVLHFFLFSSLLLSHSQVLPCMYEGKILGRGGQAPLRPPPIPGSYTYAC